MKLAELALIVNDMMDRGYGESKVLITLSQPSMGPRASVGIKNIDMGIDWENGQVRIEPERALVDKMGERDRSVKGKKYEERGANGKKLTYYFCPMCCTKVTRTARYCSHCGQAIKNE